MSFIDMQKEITSVLESIPNVVTFRGKVSDDEVTKLMPASDQIKPFIVVTFGGRIEARRQMNGITGARADTFATTFVARAVANTENNAEIVANEAWNKLIGYVPANCGEIRPALFGGVGMVSSVGSPTRFASVQAYTLYVNSDLS